MARATERYRRPICFVFAGSSGKPDGTTVKISPQRLRQSVNFQLVNEGLVYPTFYNGLFYKHREAIIQSAVAARQQQLGLWKFDRTAGVTLNDSSAITERFAVMPKLFRRLMCHFGKTRSFDAFPEYLGKRREAVLDRERVQFTYTNEIVEQKQKRVSLTVRPEQLIFLG